MTNKDIPFKKLTIAVTLAGFGIGFAFTSAKLYWFNQQNYNRNFVKYQKIQSQCRDVSKVLPTNENQSIFLSDSININDKVMDEMFSLQLQLYSNDNDNILLLYRETQMYQFEEESDEHRTKMWGSNNNTSLNGIQSKYFYSRNCRISNMTMDFDNDKYLQSNKQDIFSQLIRKYGILYKHAQNPNFMDNNNANNNGNDNRFVFVGDSGDSHGWYYLRHRNRNNGRQRDSGHGQSGRRDSLIGDIRVRFHIVCQPLCMSIIGQQRNGKVVNNNTSYFQFSISARGHKKLQSLSSFLKQTLNVKVLSRNTGSIFVMTNIAMACGILSMELLKECLAFQKSGSRSDSSEQPPTKQKGSAGKRKHVSLTRNVIGIRIRAVLSSATICGLCFVIGSAYPYTKQQ